VELAESQAFLVGQPDLGIYYTMENLTVSRLANAVGAMGLARKAHLEALLRTSARSAFGGPLIEHPLIRRDLTDLAVRTAGGLCLTFAAVQAFDHSWQAVPPYTPQYHYARFLSHLAKNRTAEHAAETTRLAMEIFGGLGFLEEYAVSRLHREALVTAIWEGASNIQALEMLEVMVKKGAHKLFMEEMIPLLVAAATPEARRTAERLDETLSQLENMEPAEAQWFSKDALNTLADIAQVALLYSLAGSGSERGGERYAKLAVLYEKRFLGGEPYPRWAMEDKQVWGPIEFNTL
jgi:hypothetical protein